MYNLVEKQNTEEYLDNSGVADMGNGLEGLKIGDTYIPFRLFNGALIPDWILARKDLTPVDKLVWAKLAKYAGKNGKCYPKQATLAAGIAVGKDTVNKSIGKLCELNLLRKINPKGHGRWKHRNCNYEFLVDEVLFSRIPEMVKSQSANRSKPTSFNEKESMEKESSVLSNPTTPAGPSGLASESGTKTFTRNPKGENDPGVGENIKSVGEENADLEYSGLGNVDGVKKDLRDGEVAERMFEELWADFPRKINKLKALKTFKKMIKQNRITLEKWAAVLKGLKKQLLCQQWIKEGGRYVPSLANWLEDERWEDEVRNYPAGFNNENPQYAKTADYWNDAAKEKTLRLTKGDE